MEEGTFQQFKTMCKKPGMEDSLKIPSMKTKRISLSDIIAATIGEDARSCDNDSDAHSDFTGMCFTNGDPQDLNFSFYFQDNPGDNGNVVTNEGINSILLNNDSSQSTSTKLQTVPEADHSSNTGDSFFNENSVGGVDFTSEFPTSLTFESKFDNHDNFLASLVEPKMEETTEFGGKPDKLNNTTNLSDDSDLEDSMHFVDPDEFSAINEVSSHQDVPEPRLKKRRLSDIHPLSTICDFNSPQSNLITLLYAELDQPDNTMSTKQKPNSGQRRRSFSGTTNQRLHRQSGFSRLNHKPTTMYRANSFSENQTNHKNRSENSYTTPTMCRARSFSEACNSDKLTPISEGRPLDTSLSSLLGSPSDNSHLSNNPFYEDLKCTLLSDLSNSASDDCPKALFDTICQSQNSDVYARERNLQSRFSTLQSKYPDEVRDLSSFYRQQSAEIETERFREIHDERVPLSYRNHLNRYYDNLLHTIMERVERSLQLLSKAKRETCVPVMQTFRTRPLLSRKAVSMMEEWYTRNYEHPYPSQTAVEALATAGQITTEQVKKWFANKRNRNKNTKPMSEVSGMRRKRQFSSRW